MSVVVSDTSPIRALAHLGLLDVLPVLYGQLLVPPEVARELLGPPAGLPSVDVSHLAFVRVQGPGNQNQVQRFGQTLDPGESEALALALEIGATAVLMDEATARGVARQLGLRPIGVLGILLESKQRGLVPVIAPLMDRLVQEIKFFISPQLRAQVLQLAGE